MHAAIINFFESLGNIVVPVLAIAMIAKLFIKISR